MLTRNYKVVQDVSKSSCVQRPIRSRMLYLALGCAAQNVKHTGRTEGGHWSKRKWSGLQRINKTNLSCLKSMCESSRNELT